MVVVDDVPGAFQFTHPGRGATSPILGGQIPQRSFQFTHPGRGATIWLAIRILLTRVSIHAPREGCDKVAEAYQVDVQRFNSRTPGGVRLACQMLMGHKVDVSIHAPREGCDGYLVEG